MSTLTWLLRWPLCLFFLWLARGGDAIAISSPAAASHRTVNMPWNVPVFLHLGRPRDDYTARWIFKPIIDTLKEAFESRWASVEVLYIEDSCVLAEQAAAATRMSIAPIMISLISHSIHENETEEICTYNDTWSKLRSMGAYVIVYNSESDKTFMQTTMEKVSQWQAHEVWHYSKHIAGIWSTVPGGPKITSRFMPPGCAKDLDLDVDVTTPRQNENQVGFVGKWSDRTNVTQEAYISLHGILDAGGVRYDAASLHDYLENYPVQLNIHSRLNDDPIAALESFRFALLLSNSACVISEPGAAVDMDVWSPVIHFANRNEMKSIIESNWMGKHEAIQQCRYLSKQYFCTMFSPAKLLEQSGFTRFLAQLRFGMKMV